MDGELDNGVDERREVARVIRTVRPAVVLGHDPWRRYRLHPDHRAAGFLTVDALVAARDPHFFPELGLAPHRPELLLLFEADLPNHVEDAHGFEEAKSMPCSATEPVGDAPWASNRPVDPEPPTGQPPRSLGRPRRFAAQVRRQLADHGSLAGLGAGEAFHSITDL